MDFADEVYLAALLDATLWAKQGDELWSVADLIRPKAAEYWEHEGEEQRARQHFLSAFLMMSAFAIENYLKGVLVCEHEAEFRREIRETRQLPDLLNTHSITDLCRAARVTVQPAGEERLLRELSAAATWAARYPTPARPREYEKGTFDGQEGIVLSLYSSGDIANTAKMVGVLRERLRTQIGETDADRATPI